MPGTTAEVAAIARLCDQAGVPLVPRGAGTGYTGGAVPVRGGVVALARALHPHPRRSTTQPARRRPARRDHRRPAGRGRSASACSIRRIRPACASRSIGGNVAECAGGPRAFKYGITRRYVLGLEAVLADGDDHPHRRQDREERRRLRPDAAARRIGRHAGDRHRDHAAAGAAAAGAGGAARDVRHDRGGGGRGRSPRAARRRAGGARARRPRQSRCAARRISAASRWRRPAPKRCWSSKWTASTRPSPHEIALVEEACRDSGATDVRRARDEAERAGGLAGPARAVLRAADGRRRGRYNHDVVVPKGRVPELFALVDRLRAESGLLIPGFGHVGDGNIHVNIMVDANDADDQRPRPRRRAGAVRGRRRARRVGHAASTASASRRRRTCRSRCRPRPSRVMQRVKQAFDPKGLLNPGKIFLD